MSNALLPRLMGALQAASSVPQQTVALWTHCLWSHASPCLLCWHCFQICYLHTLDFHHPRKESLDTVSQPSCRGVFCSVAQHFPKRTQDPLNKERDDSIFALLRADRHTSPCLPLSLASLKSSKASHRPCVAWAACRSLTQLMYLAALLQCSFWTRGSWHSPAFSSAGLFYSCSLLSLAGSSSSLLATHFLGGLLAPCPRQHPPDGRWLQYNTNIVKAQQLHWAYWGSIIKLKLTSVEVLHNTHLKTVLDKSFVTVFFFFFVIVVVVFLQVMLLVKISTWLHLWAILIRSVFINMLIGLVCLALKLLILSVRNIIC